MKPTFKDTLDAPRERLNANSHDAAAHVLSGHDVCRGFVFFLHVGESTASPSNEGSVSQHLLK